jgi:hypothetical protein
MSMPLLAAAAVAVLISFAPTATPMLIKAADAADIFDVLSCAMAHQGPCLLARDPGETLQTPLMEKRNRPMLAAAVVD